MHLAPTTGPDTGPPLVVGGHFDSVPQSPAAADNATGHGWALDGRTWQQPVLAQMMIAQNEMMLRISATETSGILRQFIE